MKIALAHDSFTQEGGAERVLEAFHELYPQAPVFTLVCSREMKEKYGSWDIRTSWLQVLYNFIPRLQYLLPFIPWAVSSLDFEGYNIVLSSSSSWIKNINVPKNCRHVNYCHTPTRFLWSDQAYVNQEVPVFLRSIAKPFLRWMKRWDYKGAQRVTSFIANSVEVQNRISLYYNRTSKLAHPFVNVDFWKPVFRGLDHEGKKENYFLIVGRLQAHKNNDFIINIFNELGLPLHVVGTGRQEAYLKSVAKPNVSFFDHISDEELRLQYSGARALIFPQVEDFGLVPLEAAACGTPVLAYGKGGALETIVPGQTGEFFTSYDKNQIKELIVNWQDSKYKKDILIQHAEKFSKEKFKNTIQNLIDK